MVYKLRFFGKFCLALEKNPILEQPPSYIQAMVNILKIIHLSHFLSMHIIFLSIVNLLSVEKK